MDIKFNFLTKPKTVKDLPIYKDTFLLINLTILCSLQAPKIVLETFGKLIITSKN